MLKYYIYIQKMKKHDPLFLSAIFLLVAINILIVGCTPQPFSTDWREVPSGTTYDLHDVKMVTPDTGFIVGGAQWSYGLILRTIDGGANWQKVQETGSEINAISFANRREGVAVGQAGKFYMTDDRGASWQFQQAQWERYRGIAHYDRDHAVAVGGKAYGWGMSSTSRNYDNYNTFDTINHELSAVAMLSPTDAVAVGYGFLGKSTDGGRTWQPRNVTGDFLTAVHFPSRSVGYTVGTSGGIWRTDDGGDTWRKLREPNQIGNAAHFRGVFFSTETDGYACGDNGLLWKTTDSGKTWRTLQKLPKTQWNAVFVQRGKGFVVGNEGKIVQFND